MGGLVGNWQAAIFRPNTLSRNCTLMRTSCCVPLLALAAAAHPHLAARAIHGGALTNYSALHPAHCMIIVHVLLGMGAEQLKPGSRAHETFSFGP
eukprot:1156673-Pelagomonas_calceolata.AAC.7